MKEPVMIRCPQCGFSHWRPKAKVSRPGVMACHKCGQSIAFQGGEWKTHRDKWGTLIPELVIPKRKPTSRP